MFLYLGITIIFTTLLLFFLEFLFKFLMKIDYLNNKKNEIIILAKSNKKIVYLVSALTFLFIVFYLFNNIKLITDNFPVILILAVSFYFYYIIKYDVDD